MLRSTIGDWRKEVDGNASEDWRRKEEGEETENSQRKRISDGLHSN